MSTQTAGYHLIVGFETRLIDHAVYEISNEGSETAQV